MRTSTSPSSAVAVAVAGVSAVAFSTAGAAEPAATTTTTTAAPAAAPTTAAARRPRPRRAHRTTAAAALRPPRRWPATRWADHHGRRRSDDASSQRHPGADPGGGDRCHSVRRPTSPASSPRSCQGSLPGSPRRRAPSSKRSASTTTPTLRIRPSPTTRRRCCSRRQCRRRTWSRFSRRGCPPPASSKPVTRCRTRTGARFASSPTTCPSRLSDQDEVTVIIVDETSTTEVDFVQLEIDYGLDPAVVADLRRLAGRIAAHRGRPGRGRQHDDLQLRR